MPRPSRDPPRFVALDVHKGRWSWPPSTRPSGCSCRRGGSRARSSPPGRRRTWLPTDAVVLEATTDAWQWHDELRPLVASVTVAHPPLVKLIADDPGEDRRPRRPAPGAAARGRPHPRGLGAAGRGPRAARAAQPPPAPGPPADPGAQPAARGAVPATTSPRRTAAPFAAAQRAWWAGLALPATERLRARQDLALLDSLDAADRGGRARAGAAQHDGALGGPGGVPAAAPGHRRPERAGAPRRHRRHRALPDREAAGGLRRARGGRARSPGRPAAPAGSPSRGGARCGPPWSRRRGGRCGPTRAGGRPTSGWSSAAGAARRSWRSPASCWSSSGTCCGRGRPTATPTRRRSPASSSAGRSRSGKAARGGEPAGTFVRRELDASGLGARLAQIARSGQVYRLPPAAPAG